MCRNQRHAPGHLTFDRSGDMLSSVALAAVVIQDRAGHPGSQRAGYDEPQSVIYRHARASRAGRGEAHRLSGGCGAHDSKPPSEALGRAAELVERDDDCR